MPKYLLKCRYTAEGLKGLMQDGGTSRREAVSNVFNSLGGKLEAMYYAMGDDDAIIIADLPDNLSVAAGTIAAMASGTLQIKTVPLLTPEEIDKAMKQKVSFRPPGR